MAKRRQPVQRTSSIEGAVSDGLGEVQSLRDEMGDWQSNMEGSNMDHLPKYEEVTECKDALDSKADEEPTIPSEFPEGLVDSVTWIEPQPKRKGRVSRALRLDQALAGIRAAAEHVQQFLDEHGEDPDDDDEREDGEEAPKKVWGSADRSEWEQYAEDLQSIVDDLEQVSFPGMY